MIIISPEINSLWMYFEKIDMLKSIKETFKLILKKFSCLLIFCLFVLNNNGIAEENGNKFVGFIESLEGEVNKEEKKEIVNLNEFDQIFVNQKIEVSSNSNATISFVDNSVLTLSGESEFIIEKFDKTSQEPAFILSIPKTL